MKTIGLIGGMSWESTQTYYRLINQQVKARLGGLHSARLVLYSVDFAQIEALQHRGEIRADSKAAYLEIVNSLAGQGAQGVILGCTEIGLLIQADDTDVPLFDTTTIHAEQAVEAALGTKFDFAIPQRLT